jgi:hypothetical protein
MSMENHGGMISARKNFWFFHRVLWQFYQQNNLVASMRNG